ncbi:hypothetical protein psal_cds_1142 [Pandoravirus salinus]|uniref:F-box domain-containing protein n=1 Tax=Pandoravirus salinus TaxID=1349410 RepID=S4VXK4_9VIRU|nr:hypothetical protein psal_cds_1142 [Pandoravirus salinus]AGO85399.2 hypothetical protein psal_cds_1142 [Pandoravirus salinus]
MTRLLDLPDELLLAILRRAAPHTTCMRWLAAGARTCRRMRPLWDDDALWRPVLARAVGDGPASAPCAGSSRKHLVRLLLTSTVKITVNLVRDDLVPACTFDGTRLTTPPSAACLRRLRVPLMHAPTLPMLALRAAGAFFCCLGRSHVWLADRAVPPRPPLRSYTFLRPIHIAGASVALYPDDALWWWHPRLQTATSPTAIGVHLVIATAEVVPAARAAGLGPPAYDVVPVDVPTCLVGLAQRAPIDAPFPVAWYAPGSRIALRHLPGCACR